MHPAPCPTSAQNARHEQENEYKESCVKSECSLYFHKPQKCARRRVRGSNDDDNEKAAYVDGCVGGFLVDFWRCGPGVGFAGLGGKL